MNCRGMALAIILIGSLTIAAYADESIAPLAPNAEALANNIDRRIEVKWTHAAIAPRADDAAFLRRVSLDLHGIVPAPEQVVSFLNDGRPDTRARLIDSMLENPAFSRHLADLWSNLLLPRNSENNKVPIRPLATWLAQGFQENRPWDEMVREMLTAAGPQNVKPAVTPFMSNSKSLAPHEATDLVSRVFLGVRLECAQCHNHPFDRWKQDDYWGLAAFFDKIQFTSKFEGLTLPPAPAGHKDLVGSNYGITEVKSPKKRQLLERAKPLPPRLLTGEAPAIDLESPPLRPALATWLASADNPWFAKAMANRVWEQLFGRGLVNPVDDFRGDNPPTHPELLDELATEFARQGFNLQHIYRGIANSRTYQRSSRPASADAAGYELYAHMPIKVLTAEQLFDSLVMILGEEAMFEGKSLNDTRRRFVEFFSTDDERDPAAYRRGIPQALKLMNQTAYERAIAAKAVTLNGGRAEAHTVRQLYLLALARLPAEDELEQMLAFMQKDTARSEKAAASVLWVLLNSSEFCLNH